MYSNGSGCIVLVEPLGDVDVDIAGVTIVVDMPVIPSRSVVARIERALAEFRIIPK